MKIIIIILMLFSVSFCVIPWTTSISVSNGDTVIYNGHYFIAKNSPSIGEYPPSQPTSNWYWQNIEVVIIPSDDEYVLTNADRAKAFTLGVWVVMTIAIVGLKFGVIKDLIDRA